VAIVDIADYYERINHFSGPRRAIGPVCVSVFKVTDVTFDLNV